MNTLKMKFTQIIAITAITIFSSTAVVAQDAKTIVADYLASWNAHDATATANKLNENVRYYDAALDQTYIGRAAAKKNIIESFMNAVPNYYWNVVGFPVIEGNQVTFEWVMGGKNTGTWADGTKGKGKTWRIAGMSSFTIEDGHIVKQSDYYNALSFYKQLDLL